MLIQNERAPNMPFAIGKEVITTDKHGFLEVEDKEVLSALLASGFVAVANKKKSAEKKMDAVPSEEEAADAPVAPAPEPEKAKGGRWKRGS